MNEVQELLNKAMPNIARRMQNELILVVPVDTGRLKNSIKVTATNEGIIIGMVDYGRWVEFGCPPHIITPKTKKALKFKIDKKIIFSKKVRHPGNRPNPFVRNTIMKKLKNIIIEEISR